MRTDGDRQTDRQAGRQTDRQTSRLHSSFIKMKSSPVQRSSPADTARAILVRRGGSWGNHCTVVAPSGQYLKLLWKIDAVTPLKNCGNCLPIYMAPYPQNLYPHQYCCENLKYPVFVELTGEFRSYVGHRTLWRGEIPSLALEPRFRILAASQFTAMSSRRNIWNSANAQVSHVKHERVFNKLFRMSARVTFCCNITVFLIIYPFTGVTA
jgi:hypothetical protein